MNGNGSKRYLAPKIIQGVGIALLIFAVATWALTDRQSALLVSAALSLIGVGTYQGAVETVKNIVTNGGKGEGAHERSNGQE